MFFFSLKIWMEWVWISFHFFIFYFRAIVISRLFSVMCRFNILTWWLKLKWAELAESIGQKWPNFLLFYSFCLLIVLILFILRGKLLFYNWRRKASTWILINLITWAWYSSVSIFKHHFLDDALNYISLTFHSTGDFTYLNFGKILSSQSS